MTLLGFFRFRAIAAVLVLAVVSSTAQADSDRLLVFAAASLQNALSGVVKAYEKRHDGNVKVSFAGSSTLARQIEQGAPADVYVSANQDWMDKLQQDGQIKTESRVDLLRNSIVLVAPQASDQSIQIKSGFDIVLALGDQPLAMANTQSVPAGIYGRQSLKSMNVWSKVESHVAQASDVRAALSLVARGQAPLGVVYASDATAEDNVRIVDSFPAGSHDAIVYSAAILKGVDNAQAKPFITFMQRQAAGKIFKHWGFKLAGR